MQALLWDPGCNRQTKMARMTTTKRFGCTLEMLPELEKQIAQGHQKKEANADRVIKRWDAFIASKP